MDSEPKTRLSTAYLHYLPCFIFGAVCIWGGVAECNIVGQPPIGTYIAILAFLGILITVRVPEGRWSKVFWILAFLGLLLCEVRNLYHDRTAHDEQIRKDQRAENDRFAALLKSQENSFAAVMKQNQDESSAALTRIEKVTRLSKENVDAVTGGDGFAYVDIVVFPVDKDGLSLMAVVHGKNVIRGVMYELTEGRPPYIPTDAQMNDILAGRSRNVTIGDLTPSASRLLGNVLHPSLAKGGYYNINMFALNGSVNEKLEVRYEPGGFWNRTLTVTRLNTVVFKSDWHTRPPTRK